jgi:NAD(P)-dependent dehydrogenase (short-subunit alcohol dehydrogenase family)
MTKQLMTDLATTVEVDALLAYKYPNAVTKFKHRTVLTDLNESEFAVLMSQLQGAANASNLPAAFRRSDVVSWLRVMHVNVNAAFIITRTLLPLLRMSQDASVVFVTCALSQRGRAYAGADAVSKFAVDGLMQVLADEMAGTSAIIAHAAATSIGRSEATSPVRSEPATRNAPSVAAKAASVIQAPGAVNAASVSRRTACSTAGRSAAAAEAFFGITNIRLPSAGSAETHVALPDNPVFAGLPLYQYRYIEGTPRFEGVMAQDVIEKMPDAVTKGDDGYYRVYYARLGIRMRPV